MFSVFKVNQKSELLIYASAVYKLTIRWYSGINSQMGDATYLSTNLNLNKFDHNKNLFIISLIILFSALQVTCIVRCLRLVVVKS